MSRLTGRVSAAVVKALDAYGDDITIRDRHGNEYRTRAIVRRPTTDTVADATYSEYYFLLKVSEFDRIRTSIGDVTPPAFFGQEEIVYSGQRYVLHRSEPYEYYDGTRQVVRVWGVLAK